MPFNFLAAYLTAAWDDGLLVEAQGYNGAVLNYDNFYVISATAPTQIPFNYLGITSVKFHDLRATFITQLLLKGVSLAQVMAVVGHTQIKTTNVYLRVLGCDLDGVTDKLGVTLPQDRLAQVIDLRG